MGVRQKGFCCAELKRYNQSLKHRTFGAGQFVSRGFVVLLRKVYRIRYLQAAAEHNVMRGFMKYITAFLLAIVSNYIFSQTDESQKFYTSTELNIRAGHFQVYQLSNWEIGKSTCWEFTINKAYNSTQWLASSMLIINGNRESKFTRISTYSTRNSDEVNASYLNASKKKPKMEEIIFAEGLKIGEPFRFSFVVTKKIWL